MVKLSQSLHKHSIPVTIPQSLELVTYDTAEGGSQLAVRKSVLQQAAYEEVNVIRIVSVDFLQLGSDRRVSYLSLELLDGGGF